MDMKKQFIKATEKYTELDSHVPAPYLRRSFTLTKAPVKAEISISGLGFYVLYVNGVDVTKGHIAPYISNPDHVCYFDTYEVSNLLTAGENVIGVILGNGMNNAPGGAVWDFQLADFRSTPRLALEFSSEAEGESVSFSADEQFLTHPSPILFDDLRLGEIYDARLEIEGWSLPGFDASDWKPAMKAECPRGKMKKCECEPIRVIKELKPISIIRDGDAFIYDFGVNSAGVPRLTVKGEAGQTITLWHAEELDSGKLYNDNIRFSTEKFPYYKEYNQTDRFICSGKADVYVPRFLYHGFRYIKVEGITEKMATPDLLTFLVMSTDVKRIGGFKCSDERINKLYEMVDNANRSNLYYFPTDCPQREKNGWTGDAAISAEQMILQYDLTNLYSEWLVSIRGAQDEKGAIPGIVPTGGWGFAWGSGPSWDQVLFRLPYVLYKFRGETKVIRDNAHAMMRYLEFALTKRQESGLIAFGLGDWVPVNKKSSEYDAPLELTDTVAVMEMARAAEEMFSAIGYTHNARYAEGIYKELRERIRNELIDKDTKVVKGECQSSQAIALYYGVFNDDEREAAFSHLLRFIHAKDDTFDSGFIGLHCVFHVLSDFGESELAFKMITRDRFPSYTLLIEEGHTALPEQFKEFEGPYRLSMNHHFLGDVSRWFVTKLAGLEVLDSKTVRIKPCPVSSIDCAEAYYELPSGKVSVKWQRLASGEVDVSYEAPEGVKII